jgi:membrane fusion protein (multidrug efflux system)
MIRLKIYSAFSMAAVLLTACSQEITPPKGPPSVGVVTMEIRRQDLPISFEFVGFTKSSHEVEIRSRVSGYLDSIYESEGKHVEEDTLLFTIDPRPFEATLEGSRGELAKQKAGLWEAKRSVERLKPLFDQKAASLRDLDNAIANELSSEALVASAEARVRRAELDLEYTSVRAPISGEIGASNLRVGALVLANETLLTTLSVVDPIWVNFSVPERDMLKLRKERLEGRIKLPADDDFDVEATLIDDTVVPERGKVNFLSPTYDVKTGTMMVRAMFPNTSEWLSPGQFVRVRILGAIRPDAIIVPQRAVQQTKKGMQIYVVNAQGLVEARSVVVGSWQGQGWIINSGLEDGETIITDGINKVRPGSLVHALNHEEG